LHIAVLSLVLLFAYDLPGKSLKFTSAGKTIHLDEYCALPSPDARLVVFLHGSGGPASKNLPYNDEVQRLVLNGYCAYLLHYLDATGGTASNPSRNYPVWVQAVEDALAFVRARTGALIGKTALIGYSLGASIALAAAARNPAFGAVVSISGSLPDRYFNPTLTLPPLLIIHGSADNLVPVSNSTELAEFCRTKKNGVCEISIYPEEGHAFSAGAKSHIADEIDRFLAKTLPIR
jgi:carboxymethylenebutenolidase